MLLQEVSPQGQIQQAISCCIIVVACTQIWTLAIKSHMDSVELVASMEYSGREGLVPLTEPFGLSNDIIIATKTHPFFKKLADSLTTKNK